MKKIQDLKPNEAVEIRTIKQVRKLLGWTNINLHLPVYIRYDRGIKYVTSIETPSTTVIYPALDFLPKKKIWKKEAFREIARLDSEVNELRHMLAKDMPVTVGEIVSINEPVRLEEKLIPETDKQPKEIDWSVPGQLVVNEKGYVWLTTGEHDENNFKGVYIKHGKDNAFEIGMVSCECVKSAFKPHTDEPIILKP